mmetsp:Transcript_52498/g.135511  ORF Transcript_52498/g.135511 Transcript_52498/m.135511 type:complete len:232 (+) Transcript_52498:269-964(+)
MRLRVVLILGALGAARVLGPTLAPTGPARRGRRAHHGLSLRPFVTRGSLPSPTCWRGWHALGFRLRRDLVPTLRSNQPRSPQEGHATASGHRVRRAGRQRRQQAAFCRPLRRLTVVILPTHHEPVGLRQVELRCWPVPLLRASPGPGHARLRRARRGRRAHVSRTSPGHGPAAYLLVDRGDHLRHYQRRQPSAAGSGAQPAFVLIVVRLGASHVRIIRSWQRYPQVREACC